MSRGQKIGFWFLFICLLIGAYFVPMAFLVGIVYDAIMPEHRCGLAVMIVGTIMSQYTTVKFFHPWVKIVWQNRPEDCCSREWAGHWERFEKAAGSILNWFALTICSGLFLGFLPGKILGKPGKGGGLAGSILGFLVIVPFLFQEGWFTPIYLTLVTFLLGGILVEIAEKFMLEKWGSMERHTGEIVNHDFNQTCIDEVHGVLLAVLPVFLIPTDQWWWRLVGAIVAFGFFRLFDAKKVWLVGKAEKRWANSAFGIMFDDTVAGVMAAVCVLVPISIFFIF